MYIMSRGVIGSDWRDPRANDDLHGTWVASGDRCVRADASKWLAIPDGLPTFLSSRAEAQILSRSSKRKELQLL